MITCCAPKLFRNHLILLPWFNFQSYNVHRTGRLERYTMMSLILFTFFIRTALENRLIAIISSWPLRSEVNSFEELLSAGWTVQTALRFEARALQEDLRWKHAIQYEGFRLDNNPGQAYLTTARLYESFSTLWKGMNFRFTFRILPEQFCLGYGLYYARVDDDFAGHFESMQRRLYDTGIYAYWNNILQEDIYQYSYQVNEANGEFDHRGMVQVLAGDLER
ncbi:hypothetical protein quinque_012301 [Culex quinquefasciatus]